MNRILLIDDDQGLCELLAEYLQMEGFEVCPVHDGLLGLEQARTGGWDAIILDVMLPGKNGFELLRALGPGYPTPILMLTARGEDTDTVVGLELGAADYVAKPCSPRVLVARLRALLRRHASLDTHHELLVCGDLHLDAGNRNVTVAGKAVVLTAAEFNLLQLLLSQAGSVVSREQLAAEGLGRPLGAYDRRIETHMAQIRRKLGPLPDGSARIHTVRGSGYQYSKP